MKQNLMQLLQQKWQYVKQPYSLFLSSHFFFLKYNPESRMYPASPYPKIWSLKISAKFPDLNVCLSRNFCYLLFVYCYIVTVSCREFTCFYIIYESFTLSFCENYEEMMRFWKGKKWKIPMVEKWRASS